MNTTDLKYLTFNDLGTFQLKAVNTYIDWLTSHEGADREHVLKDLNIVECTSLHGKSEIIMLTFACLSRYYTVYITRRGVLYILRDPRRKCTRPIIRERVRFYTFFKTRRYF